jgi:AraC-like DNA-binding protein
VVPYLEKLAIQEAQRFGLRPGCGESFVGFFRIKLREAIFDGDVELSSLAKRLGMSERTLQRRLGDEDLSYRDLVDDVRKKLALELMRAAEHTLQDIAFRLGYSHLASFNRAFKRWTGRSPGEYRDELSYEG